MLWEKIPSSSPRTLGDYYRQGLAVFSAKGCCLSQKINYGLPIENLLVCSEKNWLSSQRRPGNFLLEEQGVFHKRRLS